MILVVDNYDSFTYNLLQILEENADTPFDVVKHDAIPFDHLHRYNKILLSPGPGVPQEFPALRQIITTSASTHSIFGICLGHQAIAEVFGAALINLPSVTHGVRKQVQILDRSDYLFQNVPEIIEIGLYHSWVVSIESVPSMLKVTAISEEGLVMGLVHRLHDIRGVQFHPESIMTPHGEQIIRNWLNQH